MNNGTDRDVAMIMLDTFTAIDSALSTINTNLFAATIINQPVDAVGDLGDEVTFTVGAANATAYKWYYKLITAPESAWEATTAAGNNTKTITVTITEQRLLYTYRCRVKGIDGNYVYSNPVVMTLNETT